MEKQMVEILLDLQKEFKEFRGELQETKLDVRNIRNDLRETQSDVKNISNDLKETQSDVKDIKETVKRIETSQTDDVVALLKVTKQNAESEFLYLNKRLTEIDKRVFNLESRVER
ncbi:hypothetical protein [Rossellomorea aquimaris]|uniref:Uncharacterized protein n=1 Tax=Rossellomorea aquimaris TaxID=189382 RepID=A0A5D4U4E9_9BACI|nr:hypothetical protein [Rossellomorea aquimaris]TYS81959.1 hypothetical protein FZD05_03955 [Rossellomorea aquimaris]TYS88583.1 hypothetical protein FZC85_03950 [Rossellomorea aquimaris]